MIQPLRNRPGYTLLELLVAAAIFSGMMVVVLGTFARSAGSSAKVNKVREKTEAARLLIDAVSNDFRYLDTTTLYKRIDYLSGPCGANCDLIGYLFTPTRLTLVLRLPNPGGSPETVVRDYSIKTDAAARSSLFLKEGRNCIASPHAGGQRLTCSNLATMVDQDFLGSRYGLDPYQSNFSGLDPITARAAATTPFLGVSFNVKATTDNAWNCANISTPAGVCYRVSTTLVPEGR